MPDPTEIAEKISAQVSRECRSLSSREYAEVIDAVIDMLETDKMAALESAGDDE